MRSEQEDEIHLLLAEAWNKFLKLDSKPRQEAIWDFRRTIDQGHYIVAAETCSRTQPDLWTQRDSYPHPPSEKEA